MAPNNTPASIFCVVAVVDPDSGDVEREFLINYSHHGTKLWLTKTIVWCMTNDRQLEICAATNKDMRTRQLFIPSS